MGFSNTDVHKIFNVANYKKEWEFVYDKNYWQISPFGDGNCGLYAFACGLIDSIMNDKLILDPENFTKFINCIRKHPSTYLAKLNLNKNIASDVDKFLELIHRPNLTFIQFKFFIQLELVTPASLAAINLILSQGLRHIGVTRYEETIGVTECLPEEDKRLHEPGQWVGDETLNPLARYFGIDARLIFKQDKDVIKKNPEASYCFHTNSLGDNEATPTFSLLLENKHWYYLMPEENKCGLTRIFPSEKTKIEDEKNPSENIRRRSREFLCSIGELIRDIETNDTYKQIDVTETKAATLIESLAKKLNAIFNYLNKIFDKTPAQTNEFEYATQQAKTAAEGSTQIINAWREKWRVSSQVDAQLNKFYLHKLEEDLLKDPLTTDNSEDAALATILQNAEIANFLSRTHTTLKTRTTSPSTNNCSADIRDHNQSATAHDLRNADLCISA